MSARRRCLSRYARRHWRTNCGCRQGTTLLGQPCAEFVPLQHAIGEGSDIARDGIRCFDQLLIACALHFAQNMDGEPAIEVAQCRMAARDAREPGAEVTPHVHA